MGSFFVRIDDFGKVCTFTRYITASADTVI